MITKNRFPAGTTALAALAGAVAWAFPNLINPFLFILYRIFPFLPDLPKYHPEPYTINLGDLTFSYSLAGIIAGALFLIGLRSLPVHRDRDSRPVLSLPIVVWTPISMAIGGAVASLFAYGVGFSPKFRGLMYFFEIDPLDNRGPEPFLSAGLIIGVSFAAIMFLFFSGILKQYASAGNSSARIALGIVFRLSLIALATRFVISSFAFWSFFTYTPIGHSILFYFMIPIISGAIFGAWGWKSASRLRPAVAVVTQAPPDPLA
jgi:hypothetical protein